MVITIGLLNRKREMDGLQKEKEKERERKKENIQK